MTLLHFHCLSSNVQSYCSTEYETELELQVIKKGTF